MKARLLLSQDNRYLLLCSGKTENLSAIEARDFLLLFDDPKFYTGSEKQDLLDPAQESDNSDTVAFVNDDGTLQIVNAEAFRSIFSAKEPKLLSVPEYAELHGKKTSIVRKYCLEGRIKGAVQVGSRWLIPEDSPYPSYEGYGLSVQPGGSASFRLPKEMKDQIQSLADEKGESMVTFLSRTLKESIDRNK